MYNIKHRFIFVEVPRIASTSISVALMQKLPFDYSHAEPFPTYMRYPDRPCRHEQNQFMKRIRHDPISSLRQRTYLEGFRSFGFCRNPFTRALSWFVHGHDAPLPSAETRKRFTAFLAHLRARYAFPAFYFLSEDGKLAVDRVGRFERLHEDFAEICAWLEIGEHKLPHKHNSNFPAPYPEYYTPDARDLVLKHHAQDFQHFGYDTTLA